MTQYGPYGITCQCFGPVEQGLLIDYELAQLQQIASNMIVRVQFNVSQIADNLGPTAVPSQYDFTQVDPVVQAINAHGLVCLLGFEAPSPQVGPLWLNGKCTDGSQTNPIMLPQDWAIFAGNVASYYNNHPGGLHIEIIECGNEDYNQDAGQDTSTCNAPITAAQTATAVYQAVKAVSQNILVGSPACLSHSNLPGGPLSAYDWWKNFFQATYNGQTLLADYVNYHSYTMGVNCCNDKGSSDCYTLLGEAQYIRSQNMSLLPQNIVPIWCTEIGYVLGGEGCESSGPRTEEEQAVLLTEAMEAARTSGGAAGPPLIEAMCWYTMYYNDKGYSLAYDNTTGLRQAYYAYQAEVIAHPTWP
ncbi:MAG TPA: hypothetical protein VNG51_05960 [Ktedonobacteraceae bacterium]|nr:hypothetical protein [Ktedonobacteraceae bacterium]